MMGSDDKAATASSLPVQAGTYALLLRVPGRQQLRIGGRGWSHPYRRLEVVGGRQ